MVKSVVVLVTNPFIQKKPYLHSILACRFQIARKGQKIAIREVYMSTLTDTKVPASSKDLILVHTSTHVTTPTSFESQNCGNKVHSSVLVSGLVWEGFREKKCLSEKLGCSRTLKICRSYMFQSTNLVFIAPQFHNFHTIQE